MPRKQKITRRTALGLIGAGTFLTASETFGFTNATATRAANVLVADDPNALLAITKLLADGEAVTGDNEEVIALTNNTGEQLDLDVTESVGTGLVLADPFDDQLTDGESTTLAVSCEGGGGSGFTSIGIDVTIATGDNVEISQLSRDILIERDCPGGGGEPFFEVTITDTNSPIGEGETLTVEAKVQNTGLDQDTQDIELDIDGTVVDTQTLTLDGGQEQTITLSWENATVGIHNATVSSVDDFDTTEIEVESDDGFTYTINSVSLAGGGGNIINVTVDLTTDDPNAVLEIRSIRERDGAIRGSTTVDPAESGTYAIEGANQADYVEVDLLDGDGNVRDTMTVPWN